MTSISSPYRLEELKEHIRREIRKELKIKEGAEKLREVATDKRSLAHVATIVKNSNSKLAELKSELCELESQIILTQGQTTAVSEGDYHQFSKYFVVAYILEIIIFCKLSNYVS